MAKWVNQVLALFALIVLSPIFIVTALGIVLSDYGPIFYTAVRAGKDNIPFGILKFRSMRITDKKGSSRITSKNDSRIFLLGKVIRLLKFDELPQLINIVRGEMAIVGPRPEDQSIVDEAFDELMMESLQVLPGLASPGSIYNYTHLERMIEETNSEDFYLKKVLPLKVKLDVVYVRRRSFLYDFEIIGRTISVIFRMTLGLKKFSNPKELDEALKL